MMKKDKKNMKKDLRNIVDNIVWASDFVGFSNSKDRQCFDDSKADDVHFTRPVLQKMILTMFQINLLVLSYNNTV